MNFQINDIGLMFDIAGATILAFGFMSKTTDKIFDEASTKWNGNSTVVESLLAQKIEAWVGLILLAIGFILQLIGNHVKIDCVNWVEFSVIAVIVMLTIVITPKISGKYAKKASEEYIKKLQEANKPLKQSVDKLIC
jgi:uncharacterized membrane protein (DUF485 family)